MINHIAFIMDGNGRWAKMRNMPRSYGHKVGFENMCEIIKYLSTTEIKYASFYAFSTENWNRPKEEVDYLMMIPDKIKDEFLEELNRCNVRIKFLGLKTRIPEHTLKAIKHIEEYLADNTGIICNIMFDYGSKQELVDAYNQMIKEGLLEITESDLLDHLYTSKMPNIDLLVRTSGEMRLSNFMLVQLAYAELFFTKTYWPGFTKEELASIIFEFNNRDRRFGGIK